MARAVELEQDGDWLKILVGAFRKRPFPLDPANLLQRIKTAPLQEVPLLVQALKTKEHPAIRGAALELFDDRERWCYGLDLLQSNLLSGDEDLLLRILQGYEKTAGRDHIHHAVLKTGSLIDDHPDLDWLPHLLWIYEHSPCAFCRQGTVQRLIERSEAPRDLLEECLWDSEEDTRETAQQALAGT